MMRGAAVLAAGALLAGGGPNGDEALARIRAEGLQRSQVMEVVGTFTDVYGARLTGSPAARAAGEYARATLQEWGIASAHLQPWRFGPGWSSERFWIRLVEPQPQTLLGYPRAWTPSTVGAVKGAAVLISGEVPADLDRYRGTLKGRFALLEPDPERPRDPPLPPRFSDTDLDTLARPPTPGAARAARLTTERREFMKQRDQLLVTEGAAAALEPSRLVRGGNVMVARSGARLPSDPPIVPTAVLAIEHYGRIVRLLKRGVPVQLEMEALSRLHADSQDSFNVVGEIPGTDKKDEVVLIGGHLDSWHSATGATDNAAGCAVMMEALRILKATRVPLRRTVRIALWMGEEQGLLGSKAYVKEHLGDRTTMALEPGHARHDVYLNLDAGAGAIRGIFLQGNEAAREVFREWLAPLADLGATTVSIRNSMPGGSDHQSFDDIGVPGFQFLQDPADYEDRTRTHHTNMDVYESLSAEDLRKNAVIVAALAYQAANREEMVPRKPLPSPGPRAAAAVPAPPEPPVAPPIFPVSFNGLVQAWYAAGDADLRDTFRIRRTEMYFRGQVTSKAQWQVMIDPAKALGLTTTASPDGGPQSVAVNQASGLLQDAVIRFEYIPKVQVSVGQFKLPLSLEGRQSSGLLETVERALFLSDRARGGAYGDVRDIGVMMRGALGSRVDVQAGLFNGVAETQNDVDRNDQKAVAGSVTARPWPGLQVGGSGAWNSGGFDRTRRDRLGADLLLTHGRLTLKTEFMAGHDGPVSRHGYYGHVGWRLLPKVEGVFRLDTWDPDTRDESDPADVTERDFVAGLNVLLSRHNLKLQASYLRKTFADGILPPRNVFLVNTQTFW